MRPIVFAMITFCLLSGCVTPSSVDGLSTVNLADNPGPNDLKELINSRIAFYIYKKAGLKVQTVEKPSKPVELILAEDPEESMFLRVIKLKLFSEDLFSMPCEADLTLEFEMRNQKSGENYRKIVVGHYGQTLGPVAWSESVKNLIDGVVQNALVQLAQDPESKKIIAKYRYGTLGSIASIF